jgi:hypothetical protein
MPAVVLLLLAGLCLRLLYLATPSLDSDQAIFGLMAAHMLRGEFSIFQWGYLYMGTIESLVAAPLMLVFGVTRFALNLSPVLFSLVFALGAFLFAREAAGRTAGLWALALACFPPLYLVWTVIVARGAYSETLALGTLGAYFALRAVNAETARGERNALVGVGLALGLSFWTHMNTVIYGAAIVLFWSIERPRLLGRAIVWAGAAFFLASAPFWYGTLVHHFQTFVVATPHARPFGFRLRRLFYYRLPIVLGIHFDGTATPTIPVAAWLIVPIQAAALGFAAWSARPSAPLRERRGARLLLLLTAVLFAVYLASNFSSADTQRYLVPFYTVLVIAPALFLAPRGRFGLAATAALLLLQAVPAIREIPVLDAADRAAYRNDRAQEERLFAAIRSRGLSVLYTDSYWDGARFTFDARETIIFANPFEDRTNAYLDLADGAERAAFLFHFPEQATLFEAMLRLAGARYAKTTIEGYTLFDSITAAPAGGAALPIVAATASQNDVDASLALDRDAATRWTSDAPQRPGMWFRVDLGEARDVAEVVSWPRFSRDAPRGLRVEASLDGASWRTVAEAKRYWGPCSWARGRPLPTLDGWVVARFPPTKARFVRLTQLGDDKLYNWAIAEVEVRGPGTTPVAMPIDAVPGSGRLFVDPVSAARLPDAVRHWEGNVIERFDDLRDVSLVGPDDRVVVPRSDVLASGRDPRIGAVASEVDPFGDYVRLRGLALDTDRLARREPAAFTPQAPEERAVIDAGAPTSIAAIALADAGPPSFPRGLVARTSLDGAAWSDAEPLSPRPSGLVWTDEGLYGASLRERIFAFSVPRTARYVEITAAPRHPKFRSQMTRVTLLVAP